MTVKNRRVFELRLGKVGLVLFISGVSLLLFSFFMLGVVVGKHMEAYPERYAAGILELIREHLLAAAPQEDKRVSLVADPRNGDGLAAGTETGAPSSDLPTGDKEPAVYPPGGTADHKLPEAPPGRATSQRDIAVAERSVAKPVGEATEKTPHLSAGEGESKKTALPPEKANGKEGGMRKPPAGEMIKPGRGLFEVQVGAYRERRQAEQLINKFSGLGFTYRVVMKDLPGKGRWYRVIAGGFETREEARGAADRMAEKVGGLRCIIRSTAGENGVTE
jgi:cell division septation protein DedD